MRPTTNMARRTEVWLPRALAAFAVLVFLIPTLVAPLTYPGFYEDEPWVFLPMLETMRGNWLSFAALGEGHETSLVFAALTQPFFLLPIDDNLAIRLVSALACVCVLSIAYVIARRLGAHAAYFAPIAIALLPTTFLTLRYGRLEAFALALAFGAIAAALFKRPLVSGVLSAFAVCVHPITVWVGLPCLVAILPTSGWRAMLRYTGGGLLGMAPQTAWAALVSGVGQKYLVSSSISQGRFEVLSSLLHEPERYAAYVASQPLAALALNGIVFVLAITGIALARGKQRWIAAAIAGGPLATLALFSITKNPYYFVGALPALAIAASLGLSRLPQQAAMAVSATALIYVVATQTPLAWATRNQPTVVAVDAALARQLPPNAVVFAPLREAALIRLRPDLRFYSYHALAPRQSWTMPACADINARIRAIVASDPRKTSQGAPPDTAYLVMFGMSFPDYLAGIYGPTAKERLSCLWEAPGVERHSEAFCASAQCDVLDVRRRPLGS